MGIVKLKKESEIKKGKKIKTKKRTLDDLHVR